MPRTPTSARRWWWSMPPSASWASSRILKSSRGSSLSGTKPRTYFTLADANRTLPLVRRIVADLVALHPQWRELVGRYELLAAGARPEWGESTEQVALRSRIGDEAGPVNAYLGGLPPLRCRVQALSAALVHSLHPLPARDT